MAAKKQQPYRLRQARAYYRLAAKAMYAGNRRDRERYQAIADRLVAEERRAREYREREAVRRAERQARRSASS